MDLSTQDLQERRDFIYNLLKTTRPYLNEAERRIIGENLLQKSLEENGVRCESRCSQRSFKCSTPIETSNRPRAGSMFSSNNVKKIGDGIYMRNLSQSSMTTKNSKKDNFKIPPPPQTAQRRSHPNITEDAPFSKKPKITPNSSEKNKRTPDFLNWRSQKSAEFRRKKGLAAALPPKTDDEKICSQLKTRASLPVTKKEFNFVKKITEAEDNVEDIKNDLEEIQKSLDKINILSRKSYV